MRGSTNKSPIKLSAVKNKLTRWFVYEWRKTTRQKPHRVILRSPLLKFHYYHNKRLQVKESQYLIPTYSWTLTLIPNWTCSIVTISPFDVRLPIRDQPIAQILVHDFNHQLEKIVGCKVLQFIHDEDQEDAWSQYPTVHKHSNFFTRTMNQGKFCLWSQFAWTNFVQHLCNLWTLWRPLK